MTDFADRVLRGEITTADVPDLLRPSVAHLILLPIHKLACEVLDAPSKEMRQLKLSRVPELLRPLVRSEAERVFNLRRSHK